MVSAFLENARAADVKTFNHRGTESTEKHTVAFLSETLWLCGERL
jgi:hypothetical protein